MPGLNKNVKKATLAAFAGQDLKSKKSPGCIHVRVFKRPEMVRVKGRRRSKYPLKTPHGGSGFAYVVSEKSLQETIDCLPSKHGTVAELVIKLDELVATSNLRLEASVLCKCQVAIVKVTTKGTCVLAKTSTVCGIPFGEWLSPPVDGKRQSGECRCQNRHNVRLSGVKVAGPSVSLSGQTKPPGARDQPVPPHSPHCTRKPSNPTPQSNDIGLSNSHAPLHQVSDPPQWPGAEPNDGLGAGHTSESSLQPTTEDDPTIASGPVPVAEEQNIPGATVGDYSAAVADAPVEFPAETILDSHPSTRAEPVLIPTPDPDFEIDPGIDSNVWAELLSIPAVHGGPENMQAAAAGLATETTADFPSSAGVESHVVPASGHVVGAAPETYSDMLFGLGSPPYPVLMGEAFTDSDSDSAYESAVEYQEEPVAEAASMSRVPTLDHNINTREGTPVSTPSISFRLNPADATFASDLSIGDGDGAQSAIYRIADSDAGQGQQTRLPPKQ